MPAPSISTCLWFNDQAEPAARLYCSLFDDAEITDYVARVGNRHLSPRRLIGDASDFDLFGAANRARSLRAGAYFQRVMRATRQGREVALMGPGEVFGEMALIDGTRPAREAADYFLRQGLDPDGLAAELTTPEQRRRYIATFYTSRFWAHPGAFTQPGELDFHTEPFGNAAHLRASFGGYESSFRAEARSEPSKLPSPHCSSPVH